MLAPADFRFSRAQRGIYRLAQFPGSPYEDLFIAWLKTGSDAVISHESAHNLCKFSDMLPGEVQVIMPINRLNPDEVTRREGLPVTSAARTIVDVVTSGVAGEHICQAAVHDAIQQGLVSRADLLSMASRRNRKILPLIENILDSEIK